jgi:two-component system CheB/CheR fusion protein
MLDILDDLQHPNVAPPARLADLPIEPVLNRLRSEFSYHAEAKGLALRVVSSGAVVHSNSRSLEQLIRALLLAAMKMTSQGRVLLGCRPRRRRLRLEIWVGGEMIAAPQQQGILDEFHRGAPLPSERGLVPSIVKPLADTLGLRVKARSRPGTGLLFTIDVPMSPAFHSELAHEVAPDLAARAVVAAVSDNLPDREALKLLLQEAGYRVVAARYDGQIELDAMQPEVIVADFTVPSTDAVGRLIGALRELFGSDTPVVVIADEAWRTQSTRISDPVTYLAKPATAEEITSQVSLAVAAARARLATPRPKDRRSSHQTVFIVDDDHLLLDAMSAVLSARGERVEVYPDAESFLESYTPPRRGCLVVDDKLPGLRGVELLEKLKVQRATLPAIMITGHGDIATAVRAMRVGSIDYIEKPVHHAQLLTAIDRALEIDKEFADTLARRQKLAARYATLTQRERQVLDLVTKGASSKTISRSLNISQRTVESHRAAVMKRMGTGSLSELIHAVMELRLSQEE